MLIKCLAARTCGRFFASKFFAFSLTPAVALRRAAGSATRPHIPHTNRNKAQTPSPTHWTSDRAMPRSRATGPMVITAQCYRLHSWLSDILPPSQLADPYRCHTTLSRQPCSSKLRCKRLSPGDSGEGEMCTLAVRRAGAVHGLEHIAALSLAGQLALHDHAPVANLCVHFLFKRVSVGPPMPTGGSERDHLCSTQ